MKIITYSDLHLEFGGKLIPAPQNSADLMVLAGDGQPPFVGPVFKLQSGVCIGMKEGAGA